MLNGVYASFGAAGGSLTADPDGISSGHVWKNGVGNDNGFEQNLRYVLTSAQTKVGFAQRLWLTGLPGDINKYPVPFAFFNAANTAIALIQVTPTGGFIVHNSVSGLNYATPGPVITANAWWHLEFMVDISEGAFELRVEGQTVLSETGLDFGALPIAQTAWCTQNSFAVWPGNDFYKDVVIWNGEGTQNNDFLGSVIVASLIPNADMDFTWTPTPAESDGFAILATAPPQDATVFLDAPNPAPAPYTCALTGLDGDVTSVKALMTVVRASKTDGGDGSLQVGIISSPLDAPATTLGTDRPITVAPTYWRDIHELDPKTAAPWLPSAVGIINLQLNRTT
uniref:Concanavalin A-like lectin/glucanase n=1 Tax=Mycena chlorophos TaxID=658473 RepID=A0ABQ0KY11_MYCCL|nr:predicted protein [Mycena chlorophos]